MNNYDRFAPFYDAVMGDRSDVISLVRRELIAHAPGARSVLELGCGTGTILAGLASNYDVAGVDKSAQMLQISQRKLSNSPFYRHDIATFSLNRKFDGAFCVFDTINHLSRFAKWKDVFKRTYDHLNPGGIFIFDMITIGRIRVLMALPGLTQTADGATVNMELERAGTNTVRWLITIQEPRTDGTVQVYEDTSLETAFKLTDVTAALTDAGFAVLNSYDSFGDTPTDQSDRVYFVCRRP